MGKISQLLTKEASVNKEAIKMPEFVTRQLSRIRGAVPTVAPKQKHTGRNALAAMLAALGLGGGGYALMGDKNQNAFQQGLGMDIGSDNPLKPVPSMLQGSMDNVFPQAAHPGQPNISPRLASNLQSLREFLGQ